MNSGNEEETDTHESENKNVSIQVIESSDKTDTEHVDLNENIQSQFCCRLDKQTKRSRTCNVQRPNVIASVDIY